MQQILGTTALISTIKNKEGTRSFEKQETVRRLNKKCRSESLEPIKLEHWIKEMKD